MGKGKDTPPVAQSYTPESKDSSAEALAGMMASMMAMQTQMAEYNRPSFPQTQMPNIYAGPTIDWTEKQEQLASKAKADTALEIARKKGHLSTIHTSPLLDNEDASVTSSLLTGN